MWMCKPQWLGKKKKILLIVVTVAVFLRDVSSSRICAICTVFQPRLIIHNIKEETTQAELIFDLNNMIRI